MNQKLLIFLLAGTIFSQEFEWNESTCSPCQCYKVFCNVIKDADIDCEDQFKNSCDKKRYYLKNDSCNDVCDCCLDGKCRKWYDYFCFIYKGFEFLGGIFFLTSSMNLLLLGLIHKNFHKIKRKFNKAYFKVKDKKGDKNMDFVDNIKEIAKNKNKKNIQTHFYKYKHVLYIQRDNDSENNFLTNMKVKKVMELFVKLEAIRKIAIKNYLQELVMVLIHVTAVGLGMYTFLSLNERPYEYGINAPIIMGLFLTFYILYYFYTNKCDSYKEQVNLILDEFEEDHKCKVRIRKQKKGFEINWNPQIEGQNKAKMKGKGKCDDTTNNSISLSHGKGKGKNKNKIAPKQMQIVKKGSFNNSSEEISLEDQEKKQKLLKKEDQSIGKMQLSEKKPKIKKNEDDETNNSVSQNNESQKRKKKFPNSIEDQSIKVTKIKPFDENEESKSRTKKKKKSKSRKKSKPKKIKAQSDDENDVEILQ